MPEQFEPLPQGPEQVRPPITTEKVIAGAQRAITTITASRESADEHRDAFVRHAQPVADALRQSGKLAEAQQLEDAARVIGQTRGFGPEQAGQAPASTVVSEKPGVLRDVLAGVWAAIDKDPALRNLPETRNLRQASGALSDAGLLNITVRGGVLISFASNFADNFGRTSRLGAPAQESPAATREHLTPGVQLPVVQASAVTPAPPTAAQGAAVPAPAAPMPEQVVAQGTPSTAQEPAPANRMPVEHRPQPAPSVVVAPVIQTAVADVDRATSAPAVPVIAVVAAPTPQPMAPQVAAEPAALYLSMVPSMGEINDRDLSAQAVSHSVFQVQVDPQDAGRATLVPVPGKDEMLRMNHHTLLGDVFNVRLPQASDRFVQVERPAQLVRTAAGWKITERGTVGFSPTQGHQVQAPPAPVHQLPPTAAPHQPAPAVPFTRDDVPAEQLAKLGVSVAELEKSGQLQKLLEGKKTDLVSSFTLPNAVGEAIPFSGKLVLHRDEQGAPILKVDLPKHELIIPQQVQGKDLTPAMQAELQKNGVLPLTEGFRDGQGQPYAAYLAVDQEMKRVVAVRPEGIHIPQEVLGVKLDPTVSRQLLEGKPAALVGLTNSKSQVFDATVQLDPIRRQLTFRDVHPREHVQEQQLEPARRRGLRA